MTLKIRIAILTLAAIAFEVQPADAQSASFTGKIADYNGCNVVTMDALKLSGETTPMKVNADGTFNLEMDATQPGVYYILIESPKSGFKFYVEDGLKADFQIHFKDSVVMGNKITVADVAYTGDRKDCFDFVNQVSYFDAQNKVLTSAQGQNWPFKKFEGTLRNEVSKLEDRFASIGDETFRTLMKNDYESKYKASLIWYVQLSDQADDDFTAYVESLDHNNPQDLNSARFYLTAYKKFYLPKTGDPNVTLFARLPEIFTNRQVMDAMADEQIMQIFAEAPQNISEVYQAYKDLKGEQNIPANIEQAYQHFQAVSAGSQATDFDMYDAGGNQVTLSSFKGKAVYLDVWATWCGPCKAEIPYLAKLCEAYKDNPDIVFVSVSVDTNEKAWKTMIAKDKPAWPQYIVKGDFKSTLCTAYSINAIPRFMMFDKDGNIVSVDAMRPSDAKIKEFIDGVLNK